jgi:hypothetical protein
MYGFFTGRLRAQPRPFLERGGSWPSSPFLLLFHPSAIADLAFGIVISPYKLMLIASNAAMRRRLSPGSNT